MDEALFHRDVWLPALEKYAAVTGLTIRLYDREARLVYGPLNPAPLVALLDGIGYDPGLAGCVTECLAADRDSVLEQWHGLAMVAAPLALAGATVGCIVVGYVLTRAPDAAAARQMSEASGVELDALWAALEAERPVPERRLTLCGELLRVLGEALLGERDRARQHEELTRRLADAVGAKDRLLAVLSHELRTPLTPILTWAQVLRNERDEARIRRAAEAIERNARLEGALVDDLLDLSRLTQGEAVLERRGQDLAAIVRAAMQLAVAAARDKGVRLEWSEPGRAVFVDGDAGRLGRVFWNVLSNAVKFTPEGGSIRVTLETEGAEAVVRVRDTGVGIAPEFLPYVFDDFRQAEYGTRRQFGGLGVGLALAKRLTELHAGRIEAASAGIGHGTEVSVHLPVVLEAGGRAAPGALPGEPGRRLQGLAVLLVEDNPDAIEATRLVLEDFGARVLLARDGVEALSVLETESPDVILCDLRMPRLDGFEVIRRLRQDPRHARRAAVSVSGFGSAADRQRSRDAGFDDHLAKPFDASALALALLGAVGRQAGPGRDLAA
jgi:signal transduction histidine kinase/CheY-like chemotaxis protein